MENPVLPLATVLGMYGYLWKVHKTTLDVIRAFPDASLDWRPKPEMRSPRELVEHIYGEVIGVTSAVFNGEYTYEYCLSHMTAPKSGGVEELVAWCQETFLAAQANITKVTEADCQRQIETFFGPFSGGIFLGIPYDEWWHHRGQLTVYLRLLDVSVPNIYGYDDEPAAG